MSNPFLGRESLVRPPSPEQLDRMLRVTAPTAWIALAVLGALLVMATIWSAVSRAPIKVTAPGILLSPGGVAEIQAPAAGYLAELTVRTGDRVQAGQVIGRLDQADLSARLESKKLELAGLQDQGAKVKAFHEGEGAARARLLTERRAALTSRIQALRALETRLSDLSAGQAELLAKGYTSKERAVQAQTQLADTLRQRAEAENTLVQITGEEEAERNRAARETLDSDLRTASVAREVEALTDELARKAAVRAPQTGTVVEVTARAGEGIAVGAPIVRMLPDGPGGIAASADGGELLALLYVPAGDGKRVHTGMAAQVVPSTVKVQRDGFVRAEVISVSAIPATREGMMQRLKNTALVEQLSLQGPPIEVIVRLLRDPAGGLQWSSGRGRPIESGTIAEGKIVVDRTRLIGLVVPKLDALLDRIGL